MAKLLNFMYVYLSKVVFNFLKLKKKKKILTIVGPHGPTFHSSAASQLVLLTPSLLRSVFICLTVLLAFILHPRHRNKILTLKVWPDHSVLLEPLLGFSCPEYKDCAFTFVLAWFKCHPPERPALPTLFKTANSSPALQDSFS